jgi:hypothetical protein
MSARLLLAARGAGAGTVASAAMGLVFLVARRAGIVRKVPPDAITETALDSIGVDPPETAQHAASGMSHLAFGAAAGAVYGLLHRHLPVGPVVGGLAFAGVVMAASYEGWVPAMGALPPLHAQSRGGRLTLIAGHVVYGSLLGRLASVPARAR